MNIGVRWAWVVDRPDSALAISAQQRARLNENISIFYALDYASPKLLIEALLEQNVEVLLFSWRFLLFELLKFREIFEEIQSFRNGGGFIGILIPDHIGQTVYGHHIEEDLLTRTDFHMVTSELLNASYASQKTNSTFKGVIHDLPNFELIEKIRKNSATSQLKYTDVIWVGNSTWGNRQNFQDHKGFVSIVKPLQVYFSSCLDLNVSFKIIDSAEKRIANHQVLLEVQKSRLLIQTSASEGTGIPLLEALGLGTQVLTTRVGIAEEILGRNSNRIIERDFDAFREKILEIAASGEWNDNQQKDVFDSFMGKCRSESLPAISIANPCFLPIKCGQLNRIYLLIRWKARYTFHKIRLKKTLSESNAGT
jgi:glycosyltransferase involved in cell wall biosynthesis